jgi:hypothetical protein
MFIFHACGEFGCGGTASEDRNGDARFEYRCHDGAFDVMRTGFVDDFRRTRLGIRRSGVDIEEKLTGLQISLCVARDIEHGVGGYGGDDDIGVARRFRRVSCGDNTGLSRALSERAGIEEDVVGQNRNIAARQKLACECLADFAIADECKSHRNPHTRSLRGAKRRSNPVQTLHTMKH